MAPVPFRGRVSHTGMIPLVAQQIAALHAVPVAAVLAQTTRNACKMYGLPVPPTLQELFALLLLDFFLSDFSLHHVRPLSSPPHAEGMSRVALY